MFPLTWILLIKAFIWMGHNLPHLSWKYNLSIHTYLFHLTRINNKDNIIDCDAGFSNIGGKDLQWDVMVHLIWKQNQWLTKWKKEDSMKLTIFRTPAGGFFNTFFWSDVCIFEWSIKTWYLLTIERKNMLWNLSFI